MWEVFPNARIREASREILRLPEFGRAAAELKHLGVHPKIPRLARLGLYANLVV